MKIVADKFIQETFFDKNPQINKEKVVEEVNAIVNYPYVQYRYGDTRYPLVREGYRKGVWLVSLNNVEGFKMRSRELVEGDYFFGQYKARRKGEAPRKAVKVLHVGELPQAKYVDAIVYERWVLEEDRPVEHDGDAEIVGFLTKDTPEKEPMEYEVLLHNHFKSDGGTDTQMSNDEFVKALRESFLYWKNRGFIH